MTQLWGEVGGSKSRHLLAGLFVAVALGILALLGFTGGGSLAANGCPGYGYGYGYGSGYGYCPAPNQPPVCQSIVGPLVPVQVGASVTVTASFTDPDTGDTHTATFAWGDGTTSPGVVVEASGSGTATGTHAYSSPGVYSVVATIRDNEGAVDTCTFEFVVVFDPSAGFVTGGGWITSPPGAYTPDPTATGKATFGFVSKYQKGAAVPTGTTEFQFHAGDLNFKSTSYQWLVIAGPKAMYKGEGTINGEPGYSFQLSAIDGAIAGGGGVDAFRIRIWETATNVVIYDNKLGSPDNADPTQALGGGSIVIHKGK